jgi:hypothetical protein
MDVLVDKRSRGFSHSVSSKQIRSKKMQVIINSDSQVDLKEQSMEQWQQQVADSLQRFNDWITRVEVHLTDENSQAKGGPDDIRCLIEARPASRQPVSVEVRAATAEQALLEGARTMKRRLATMQDKARTESRDRD